MEVKPKNGDILKIYRGGYWHWAVYVGNDEVIHYSSKDSDKSLSNNKIVQESLTKFIREASKYEIVNFPEKYSGIRTSTKTQYGISSFMPQPGNFALDRIELTTSHGYQLIPYLFVGAGAGADPSGGAAVPDRGRAGCSAAQRAGAGR